VAVVYDGDAARERLAVNDCDFVESDRDLPLVAGDGVCTSLVDSGLDTRILMSTAAAAVTVPSSSPLVSRRGRENASPSSSRADRGDSARVIEYWAGAVVAEHWGAQRR
jgi:hypothetical protein